jgi:D-lactate dehydrogenase
MKAHPGDAPVMDSAEFLLANVLPKLTIKKIPVLAVHHNCSAQHLNEQQAINELAAAMAEKVIAISPRR